MSLTGESDPERKRSRGKKPADAAAAAPGDAHADRALDAEVAALAYEEALEQLEAIIDRVEHGEIGLEATLAEYRRGRALLRRCQSVLDAAEQDIKRLSLSELEATGRGTADDSAPF